MKYTHSKKNETTSVSPWTLKVNHKTLLVLSAFDTGHIYKFP